METLTEPQVTGAQAHAYELLYQMLLIRRFEEKAAEMYSLGKIRGFLHLCIGEEAIPVGAMRAFGPNDAIVATYREHGHALARGLQPEILMAEMFGKVTGCSHGRGGSMHFFDIKKRFYGGHAIVGGGLPIAVGLALASKMQQRSEVTACFFGDGAMVEGEFHESMNLAALWQLPVLFLCENNLYAMGTALAREHAQTDLRLRAESYGMKAEAVDGMDVLAVEAAVQQAADAIRANQKPYFLELKTYRFRAHSMSDPELYRDKEEVSDWKKSDPILRFQRQTMANGLITEQDLNRCEIDIEKVLAQAVTYAENSPLEPVSDLLKDVYTT